MNQCMLSFYLFFYWNIPTTHGQAICGIAFGYVGEMCCCDSELSKQSIICDINDKIISISSRYCEPSPTYTNF